MVNESGQKRFSQRKPDGSGGWTYKLGDVPRVLYNLPAVLQAKGEGKTIYLVEGEKDADALIALGRVATTMPNGAGSWDDIHTEALRGAKVRICADNDTPGLDHAFEVKATLEEAGCTVQVYRTPVGKDIAEFLALDGDLSKMVPLNTREDADSEAPQPEPQPQHDVVGKIGEIFEQPDLAEQQKINKAISYLAGISLEVPADEGRLVTWDGLVAEADNDAYDWVIPGVLERQERVIVVAAEGVGKSTWARQVALMASFGLHPFTRSPIDPVRTLYVDLENPERIVRRNGRPILQAARHLSSTKTVEAHLLIKPAGMDLLRQSDRTILERAIETTKPEILFLGPLYKAFIDAGGRTSESVAVEVARYLDYIRDVYGCALWLEHHAPLGNSMATRELRPFGSAVWSRWPEFGLALQPDPTSTEGYVYDVRHFRGERDQRQWPLKMKRGKLLPFEVLEFKKVH